MDETNRRSSLNLTTIGLHLAAYFLPPGGNIGEKAAREQARSKGSTVLRKRACARASRSRCQPRRKIGGPIASRSVYRDRSACVSMLAVVITFVSADCSPRLRPQDSINCARVIPGTCKSALQCGHS